MGGSQSQPKKPEAPVSITSERLNTKDLEEAIELTLNYGKKREKDEAFRLFGSIMSAWDGVYGLMNSNDRFRQFMESESGRAVSRRVVKTLDADGDGRITPRDFQIIYNRDIQSAISRHQTRIDQILPFVGQCTFGLVVGWTCGRFARQLYRQKVAIVVTGFLIYTGVQFMAQQNYVNQVVLEAAFRQKLKELADVNGDGEINREDVNALVENRMRFIATKLGPGGIAPGMVGYATLGLGLLRGLRRI